MPDQVSTIRDRFIALRIRQLLSGHAHTWVMLEATLLPQNNRYNRSSSRSRTVYLRVEEYVGQFSRKPPTEKRKKDLREARDSALLIEATFDHGGTCRAVVVNDIKLTNYRGWMSYRIKRIIEGLVWETDLVTAHLSYDSEIDEKPDRMPAGIARIIDHGDDQISYVRRKGFLYHLTDRVTKRGASGKIHVSEPTSARHSAYPGW